jgi:hypothetical protein
MRKVSIRTRAVDPRTPSGPRGRPKERRVITTTFRVYADQRDALQRDALARRADGRADMSAVLRDLLVPNRKWYAKLKGAVDASSEFLLIHRVGAPLARQPWSPLPPSPSSSP